MEQTFNELKKKDVINLIDGKHLGKVCDLTFTFPENHILGITVTGCKGFKFSRQDIFIPIKSVVKIGEDAILVKFGEECKQEPPCPPPHNGNKLPPPNNCPPPQNCYPPNNCPPPQNCCPPNNCRPNNGNFNGGNRRNFDEYE